MASYKNLGVYLKQKRIESGYTQVELSKILGYSSSQFVSNWERGLSSPPEEGLQKLIKLFKLSREVLVYAMVQDYKDEIKERIYRGVPRKDKKTASE